MTESSQDKTKRKLINHIKTIKPTHQTAIFFNNFDDAFLFRVRFLAKLLATVVLTMAPTGLSKP
ncbi:TPA: hypothetical protein ACMDSD_003641, partial [Vibrio cholerae]